MLRRIAYWAAILLVGFYVAAAVGLLYLRFFDPLTTAVQVERRVGAWLTWTPYDKQWEPVPMASISTNLQHAVVAAEDGRFYHHNGLDWLEMEKVVAESQRRGHVTRGASTITQQLVKNLFLSTKFGGLRKLIEIPLALLADLILPKQRILELYLNVVEWGPGVFGAEAAAQFQYGVSAATLGREQSARLAAILPAPRTRKPARMNGYAKVILQRMAQMNW